MDTKDGQQREVYERIPWEQLAAAPKDRQWLAIAIAGAVVVGALAYSFASNRAPAMEPVGQLTSPVANSEQVPAAQQQEPVVPPTESGAVEVDPPAPRVLSEADLYAIPPQTLEAQASAHAELVVREYLTADGSGGEAQNLRLLLPSDIPLPVVPDGYLSFVEWVRAMSVTEVDSLTYRVEVLAMFMTAVGGGDYVRQLPQVVSVDIKVDDTGPILISAPTIADTVTTQAGPIGLGTVPQTVMASVSQSFPTAEVVGGLLLANGQWQVVVQTEGPGGIILPQSIVIGP